MKQPVIGEIAKIDATLARFALDVRERKLKTALRKAATLVNGRIEPLIPRPGTARGGIEYTERKGGRLRRPQLSESLGIVVKGYQGAVVAVGGPMARAAGRHAHLVERGFKHTSGGTLANSGGRTRYAYKTTHYERVMVGAGKNRRAMWSARRQRVEARRGTGRVNKTIPARPYVTPAVTLTRADVTSSIVSYLQRAAKRYDKRLVNAELADDGN